MQYYRYLIHLAYLFAYHVNLRDAVEAGDGQLHIDVERATWK